MKLNPEGLAAVTAIVRESSDLSVEEATVAATALLMAYFEARERSADLGAGDRPPAPMIEQLARELLATANGSAEETLVRGRLRFELQVLDKVRAVRPPPRAASEESRP